MISENIVIEGLYKKFKNSEDYAINDLNLQTGTEGICGIVGPDGAGKTTLMRLILGLLIPTSGSIKLFGLDPTTQKRQITQFVGYMPQKFELYEDLSVIENLELFYQLYKLKKENKEELFRNLLEVTRLLPFKTRFAKNLSGGMKQKLALICALLSEPKILLLDEPTVGVDPVSRLEIMELVQSFNKKGMGVLWSTSYFSEAEKFEQLIIMNEGKILKKGKTKDLINSHKTLESAVIDLLGGYPKENTRLLNIMPKVENDFSVVLKAENLTKKYNGFTAVSDVSFRVEKGKIFGLIGPNGAGKTTTFKLLCGLIHPTNGSVEIMRVNTLENLTKAHSYIGYMAQKFSLYGNLTVKQNLDFFAGIYGLSFFEKDNKINEMVDVFKLTPYLNMNTNELPLGFQQRLSLACSLIHVPPILFLDEATSGVDPQTRHEFWSHIKGIAKKGYSIVITTHFMDEAENCDEIAFLYKSKNIAMGSPKELMAKTKTQNLEDAFIQLVRNFDEKES